MEKKHNRGDDVNALNELRLSIENDPEISYISKVEISNAINALASLIMKHYNIKCL